jgi:hypothetical protein
MATSYLIVTKWRGDCIINNNDSVTFALIKRVEAQGRQARELGKAYAKKLNGGIDYRLETGGDNLTKALQEDLVYYTVCSIPDSQAREYNSYLSWENCEVFNPVK